jgi:hypothetical protein
MADTTGMLSAIARGLRAGAGVLSPEVFAQNERERQMRMLQSEQGKQQLFSLISEGIQSGAIEPDKGMEALRKLNPQMAEQMAGLNMGPSIAAQKQVLDLLRQQQAADATGRVAADLNLPVGAPESLVAAAYKARNPAAKAPDNALVTLSGPGGRKVTLRRGDPRVDALLQGGFTEYEKPTQRDDQRERKIQALQSQGLSRPDAENIVDRNLDIQINPATGRVVLTDLVTRRVTELPVGGGGERTAIPESKTLYSLAGEGATGLAPAIAETGSKVTGQIGGPVAAKVTQRRQAIRTAQQDLIRALSVNPRFPVAEQERIRKEISIDPSILDSDESLRARMRAVDQALRIRLSQAERDANDPNLPEDLRSSQAQNAAAIRNFLDLMGVPAEEGGDDDALIQKWLGK